MRLDSDARHPLTWHGTMTADPTSATVALEVDEVVYAMAWDGAATESLAGWLRSAQTADMFCGSDVTPVGSDVQLVPGRHVAQVLVTLADGQVIPARPSVLIVD